MTDYELGWVVGFLEGEGCFHKRSDRPNGLKISVTSTDQDALLQLQRFTELGQIYGPRFHKNPSWKPFYHYQISSNPKARQLMSLVLPHMGERRSAHIKELLNA